MQVMAMQVVEADVAAFLAAAVSDEIVDGDPEWLESESGLGDEDPTEEFDRAVLAPLLAVFAEVPPETLRVIEVAR